jgi:hypothetical protein
MASSHKPPNVAEPALPPSFRMQIAVAAAVAINARSERARPRYVASRPDFASRPIK